MTPVSVAKKSDGRKVLASTPVQSYSGTPMENLTLEVIGPDEAKQLLDGQGPQRSIRPHKIKQFTDDMREGRWLFNGAPIVKDRNDRMRDGQNRMHAIINSGTTQTFVVLNNASEHTIATIDTGTGRTFTDVTRMQGIPYASEISSAVYLWWKYDNDAMNSMERPSHKQLEAKRDEHLNALEAACKMVASKKNARSLAPKSALVFILAYLYEKNPAWAAIFLDALDTGLGLTERDPLYVLQRYLIRNMGRRHRIDTPSLLAVMIKAFNFKFTGREIQTLIWRRDEAYPKFVAV
jgi:hypothetical protein